MKKDFLKDIALHFSFLSPDLEIKILESGLINFTCKLTDLQTNKKYILQKINIEVFPNVNDLINNSIVISEHINKKLNLFSNSVSYQNYNFYKSSQGNYLLNYNGIWRLFDYIENTDISLIDNKIASETGKLLGEFHLLLEDLKTSKISEIIKDFHRIDIRYEKLTNSVKAKTKRLKETKLILDEINNYKYLIDEYKVFIKQDVPIRIVHNDPKVSNILFNDFQKAITLIDLDTVMPGYINNDFGDAIRTLTNSSSEDEKNTDIVHFNFDYFKSFTYSYLKITKQFITKIEKDHLALFVLIITLEQAIRFYNDFIDGDIYYKTDYENHNLVRTNVQLKLLGEMLKRYKDMKTYISLIE